MRWGKLIVRVKDRKIAKQRFQCSDCKKSFLYKKDNEKLTVATKRKLTKLYLEGRTSYRTLASHHGLDKNTVYRVVLELISNLPSPRMIAKALKPKWGHILAVDGKYVRVFDWSAEHFDFTTRERRFSHKKVFLAGIDLRTSDIPYVRLGDEETMIDLMMYFEGLREVGYDLQVLVSDGNPDIERAARKVYGDNFSFQLCHKHFLEGLRRYLNEETEERKLDTEQLITEIGKALVRGRQVEFWGRTEAQHKIIKSYEKNHEKLSVWTRIKGVPRTSNQIENLFRQLNLRLKTVNQFQTYENAEYYLNALVLARRFTKFTCCRGKNKMKNGKAPLELANCNIEEIDYLKTNSIFRR